MQLFLVLAVVLKVRKRFSKFIKSSVGSDRLIVELLMAVSVQSRASASGILVNGDFKSSRQVLLLFNCVNTVLIRL